MYQFSDQDCCICQQSLTQSSVRKLNCTHEFHKSCITDWFKQQKNCPICRRGPNQAKVKNKKGKREL